MNSPEGSGLVSPMLDWFQVVRWQREEPLSRVEVADGQIRAITRSDFLEALKGEPYLKRRWPYYREAIALAKSVAPARTLEIGCRSLPLFFGSHTLDYEASFKPTFLHNATVVPWPIADQSYDLVMALQVWEHLEGRQIQAFDEVKRCAKFAILSLPYRWRSRNNPSHAGIDDDVVRNWTGGLEPVATIQVPRFSRRKRKIYLFDLRTGA